MDFYKELSKYYDAVFPANEKQVKFLSGLVDEDAKILDVGCATGTYAIPLARMGFDVFAFDLGNEMIDILHEKEEKEQMEEMKLKTFKMDMRDIAKLGVRNFDLVYCIGNTLVHLNSKTEVKDVLTDIYEALADKGKFVLQIVNYDRVIKDGVTELPTIERSQEDVTFERKYNSVDGKIEFKGILSVKKGEKVDVFEETTELLPLLQGELEEYINEIGFKSVEFFGNFESEEFDIDNSTPLILVATK